MRAFETTLSQPQPSRIFGWSRGRKWVQSDMQAHETSLSRIHPSRILGLSRGENEFPVPVDHLKHRFLDLTKGKFYACQEAENDF